MVRDRGNFTVWKSEAARVSNQFLTSFRTLHRVTPFGLRRQQLLTVLGVNGLPDSPLAVFGTFFYLLLRALCLDRIHAIWWRDRSRSAPAAANTSAGTSARSLSQSTACRANNILQLLKPGTLHKAHVPFGLQRLPFPQTLCVRRQVSESFGCNPWCEDNRPSSRLPLPLVPRHQL